MKLRNLAVTAIVLSSAYLVGCTATGSVQPNPTASATVSPSATPSAGISAGVGVSGSL